MRRNARNWAWSSMPSAAVTSCSRLWPRRTTVRASSADAPGSRHQPARGTGPRGREGSRTRSRRPARIPRTAPRLPGASTSAGVGRCCVGLWPGSPAQPRRARRSDRSWRWPPSSSVRPFPTPGTPTRAPSRRHRYSGFSTLSDRTGSEVHEGRGTAHPRSARLAIRCPVGCPLIIVHVAALTIWRTGLTCSKSTSPDVFTPHAGGRLRSRDHETFWEQRATQPVRRSSRTNDQTSAAITPPTTGPTT
jgi:hypothetical protein